MFNYSLYTVTSKCNNVTKTPQEDSTETTDNYQLRCHHSLRRININKVHVDGWTLSQGCFFMFFFTDSVPHKGHLQPPPLSCHSPRESRSARKRQRMRQQSMAIPSYHQHVRAEVQGRDREWDNEAWPYHHTINMWEQKCKEETENETTKMAKQQK